MFFFNKDKKKLSAILNEGIFLDRNPIDIEVDRQLIMTREVIMKNYNLKNVFLGYNLLRVEEFENTDIDWVNIGHTSTIGYDNDDLINAIQSVNAAYLSYLAIPIDDDDYFIERNDLEDFDFSNQLSDLINTIVVCVGAVSHKGFERCRTFKWIISKS